MGRDEKILMVCLLFIYLKARVDWSGRHFTPAGNRAKRETPQAVRRGVGFFTLVKITFLYRSPRKGSACSGKERTCFRENIKTEWSV